MMLHSNLQVTYRDAPPCRVLHACSSYHIRTDARARLDVKEYREQMAGIYTTSVGEATLDEAPGAYKSKEDIIGPISEAVDIIEVMRPIFNFKAS